MKPEEQRIAIAEACGWILESKTKAWHKKGVCYCADEDLPNYLTDLNAMHEAVQQFRYTDTGSTLWAVNQEHLRAVVSRDLKISPGCVSFEWEVSNATASQRAEAFLRTLNLWKD